MDTQPHIVITGLGLVTSLGKSPDETWRAIAEESDRSIGGNPGLGPMSALEQRPRHDKGGGQAVDLPADFHADTPRAARYLRFTIEQALAQSRLKGTPATRTAAALGTTMHGMRAGGDYLRTGDPSRLRGFLAGSVLDDAIADLPIGPIRLTTCSACSSGLGSIALGITLLRAGLADAVIVGGYDSVSEYAYAGFDSLRLIASGPPRPFSAERDGMKVAEGYGVLVIERAPDAAARGAPALATIAGFGESSDSFHLTQPHPDGTGAAAAILAALASSGLPPREIDLIIAHGTGTPNNDAAEYAALYRVLGADLPSIPVVALKSHLGHTLGGAGAIELILAILAQSHGIVPPTANTSTPDPAFPALNLARGPSTHRNIHTTLNLSLGFGGANTCIVLSDPPTLKSRPRSTTNPRSESRAKTSTPTPIDKSNNHPVITGLGLILPGALNAQELATLLRSGPPVLADTGPIPEERYAHLLGARRSRRMSEYAKLMVAAASAACDDAGLGGDANLAARSECCAILGTTHGSSPFCETYYSQIVKEGMEAANPVLFAEGVPNAAAAHLSMTLGLRGGCQTIIGTRNAGLHALILASARIREELWTCAIVGAAEEFSEVVNSAYAACGMREPTGAWRTPGFVTGAGAVAFMIESRSTAEARGVRILGELGESHWSDRIARESIPYLLGDQPTTRKYFSALGAAPPDRAAAKALQQASPAPDHRSIHPQLPELFSVGPLAALAAALLEPAGAFGIIGQEFTGAACGIPVQNAGTLRVFHKL